MKVVFFGTPEYVIPVLAKLHKYHKIAMVVTQSPKPAGREQRIAYSPVDGWAFSRHIPKTFDLNEIPEADLGIVAAYGKIIPESVINKFKYGVLNLHPSLLPKYRGASPVAAAIVAGDSNTGLTIIKMDNQVDHGPIISQFKEEIHPDDTAQTLRNRLFERSAQFLVDLIPSFTNGRIKPKEQDHAKATTTKILKKADGFIDLKAKSKEEADRFIRTMSPWPGAWTYVQIDGVRKRLKLINKDKVQLEGKNPVNLKQFEDAYQIKIWPSSASGSKSSPTS